ncbi:hypothetical protein CRE_13559 [Caenorhabditis remanei]|uniref:ShKT domain-containing protein n=1 Tax=Caenorhabditis remanei TaxID=31234 RepID=E3MRB2_CAERE|nr:hypothetical protein CRE_13559 [Caenorhabditis remanei]
MPFIVIISTVFLIIIEIRAKSATTTTMNPIFLCKDGRMSSIGSLKDPKKLNSKHSECKKGWFGITSCENKTMVCEQKMFCCPKPVKTTMKPTSTGTTVDVGIAETAAATDTSEDPKCSTSEIAMPTETSEITESSTSEPIEISNCENCDLEARHSCFISLHIDSNATSESFNPDCVLCENCCDDAFPHICEIWKNHDFCDMEWYSRDTKLILCGKTCGLC